MALPVASEEQFTCAHEGCGRSFKTRRLVNRHRNTHTKPYKCDTCPKGFAWRAELKRHEQFLHRVGNQRFVCNTCDKSWSRKDSLRQHEQKVHLLPASICQKQSNYESQNGPIHQNISLEIQIPDLWHAASSGNVGLVRYMLQAGADISSKADDGSTPLHCAARARQAAVVKMLLHLGADPLEKNVKDSTPLMEAVRGGEIEIIRLVLDSGFCTDPESIRDAIFTAIGIDHLQISIFLMQRGGLEDAEDIVGFLTEAFRAGATSLLQHLFEKLQDNPDVTNDHLLAVLAKAARYGHVPIFQSLLAIVKLSTDDTSHIPDFLFQAVEGGHADILKLVPANGMADHGVLNDGEPTRDDIVLSERSDLASQAIDVKSLQVNQVIEAKRWQMPLHRAAKRGYVEITRLLLERKDVLINCLDSRKQTPLHHASERGHVEVVQLLLEHKDVLINCLDQGQNTPLHWASERGHVEVVQLLLEHKDVLINCLDQEQKTPLHWASIRGDVEVVQLLLEHKDVLINYSDNMQKTPLHYASGRGYVKVVQLLLKHKDILINYPDYLERTPLHHASERGYVKVVQLLLKQKDVLINYLDYVQQTPLHHASERGHFKVVQLLLGHEAIDINIRTNGIRTWTPERNHSTALEFARLEGHEAIVNLLLENGAVDGPPDNHSSEIMTGDLDMVIDFDMLAKASIETHVDEYRDMSPDMDLDGDLLFDETYGNVPRLMPGIF